MQNQESPNASPLVETHTKNPKIEVQVESFPTPKPKFTKEAWDSGEGAGEGD